MNPVEIFFSKLYPDTGYFIPLVLDYVKAGSGKTGYHFRVPFVNTKSGYVEIVKVPVELLEVYLPFQEVSYSKEKKRVNKVPLGSEEDIVFYLSAEENKPGRYPNSLYFPGFSRGILKIASIKKWKGSGS